MYEASAPKDAIATTASAAANAILILLSPFKSKVTAPFSQAQAWDEVSWLGRPVHNAPTDLLVYQEIVSEVGPDWIIETGTGDGGHALFLASLCDLLGHGQVVSIDTGPAGDLPQHPRITYLDGRAHSDEVVAQGAGTRR